MENSIEVLGYKVKESSKKIERKRDRCKIEEKTYEIMRGQKEEIRKAQKIIKKIFQKLFHNINKLIF